MAREVTFNFPQWYISSIYSIFDTVWFYRTSRITYATTTVAENGQSVSLSRNLFTAVSVTAMKHTFSERPTQRNARDISTFSMKDNAIGGTLAMMQRNRKFFDDPFTAIHDPYSQCECKIKA